MLARVAATPGYVQIHSDGSSRPRIGHSYAVTVIQSHAMTIHSAFVAAYDAAVHNYDMEVLGPARGLGQTALFTKVLEIFSDNSSFVNRGRRLAATILATGQVPTRAIVHWAARTAWMEAALNLVYLRPYLELVTLTHVPAHRATPDALTVMNCRQDHLAGRQYENPTSAPLADCYYSQFELDSAICTPTGAPPARPLVTLRIAAEEHWTAACSCIPKRGAFARYFQTRQHLVSSWSLSLSPSLLAAAARTRFQLWLTSSRVSTFFSPKDAAALPTDCQHCLAAGVSVRDDTTHAQRCPNDSRWLSHIASWLRRLDFAVPGLWIWASLTTPLDDMQHTLSQANATDALYRFAISPSRTTAVDVVRRSDSSVVASVALFRFSAMVSLMTDDSAASWTAIGDAAAWGVSQAPYLSQNGWTTPIALMRLLVEIFGIYGELCSCVLNASPLLRVHVSGRLEDTAFNMIFDLFSDATRAMVRAATAGRFLLNPPYSEGTSSASAVILEQAIAWAGTEIDAANATDRDLAIFLLVPYQTDHPSRTAVRALGKRARVVMYLRAGSMAFESGNAWHVPSPSWPHISGQGRKLDFPVAIVEVASMRARSSFVASNTYNAVNAARFVQWAAANRERGATSTVTLRKAVWGPSQVFVQLWRDLTKSPSWVAEQMNCPIPHSLERPATANTPLPHLSWDGDNPLYVALRSVPTLDWDWILIPPALETAPAMMGLIASKRWRSAVCSLASCWTSVEADRKIAPPPRDAAGMPRAYRTRSIRAADSCSSLVAALGITRSALGARSSRVYGVDLGRPAAS